MNRVEIGCYRYLISSISGRCKFSTLNNGPRIALDFSSSIPTCLHAPNMARSDKAFQTITVEIRKLF